MHGTMTQGCDGVYVSLTTYAARIPLIQPVIQSVLRQWPADQVLLTIADTLDVPANIMASGIHILRSPDYVAFKKHAPTYLRLGIGRYIVIDDDCLIPQGWFENLIRWSHGFAGHVVCGAGRGWSPDVPMEWAFGTRVHGCNVSTPTKTHVYIGSGTALFEPGLFEESVFPFHDPGFGEPGDSNWTGGDDIWFSATLRSEVKIIVVPFLGDPNGLHHPDELEYSSSPDCIWLSEKTRGFARWNRALEHFEDVLRARAR
jgi:hypothetical protein